MLTMNDNSAPSPHFFSITEINHEHHTRHASPTLLVTKFASVCGNTLVHIEQCLKQHMEPREPL